MTWLNRVLLTKRWQFVYKIAALFDLVDELHKSFEQSVDELCDDESTYPEQEWHTLDAVHYDLTTCLREIDVLFKSFLHALATTQLSDLEENFRILLLTTRGPRAPQRRHLAHRRISLLKGQ